MGLGISLQVPKPYVSDGAVMDDKVQANKGHIRLTEAQFTPNPTLLYKERFCIKACPDICSGPLHLSQVHPIRHPVVQAIDGPGQCSGLTAILIYLFSLPDLYSLLHNLP